MIKKNNIIFTLLLFLVWPAGALAIASRFIYNKSYSIIILLFSFLYGYSIYMYSGDVLDYSESYNVVINYSWYDFFTILNSKYSYMPYNLEYSISLDQPDFYAITLEFLVSRVSDNPRWFFALISLFYAWIFLLFINFVSDLLNVKFKKKINIYFLFLIFIIPFYVGVTGVRFWPALFVFCLFVLKYFTFGKVKYLLYACLSILIHYSFFLPVLLLIPFYFLNKSKAGLNILLIGSLVIFLSGNINSKLNVINTNFSGFSEKVDSRTESYVDAENLDERTAKVSKRNWYAKLNSQAINYFLILIIVLINFNILRVRQTKLSNKIKTYVLFTMIITLLIYDLGSISRFKRIFQIFALIYLASLYQINKKTMRFVSNVCSLIFVLYIMVTFRAGFYTVDPYLLVFGGSVLVFMLRSDISLSELLVGH